MQATKTHTTAPVVLQVLAAWLTGFASRYGLDLPLEATTPLVVSVFALVGWIAKRKFNPTGAYDSTTAANLEAVATEQQRKSTEVQAISDDDLRKWQESGE
jgi:hypothetical protein